MNKTLNRFISLFKSKNIGYKHLVKLCKVRNEFNAFNPRSWPVTSRFDYIEHELEKMCDDVFIDCFNLDGTNITKAKALKYVNIYSFFEAKEKTNETILFLAHHDVVNINGENCQDNTASVCNLLHLCSLLKDINLDKNVLIAFTDAEELGSTVEGGAKRLSNLIKLGGWGKIIKSINLELTANGDRLYVSSKTNLDLMKELNEKYGAVRVKVPYNDNVCLELNGVNGVCIGTLRQKDFSDVLNTGFCKTWGLCHSINDTIDNASKEDMTNFVKNVLLKIAMNG